MAQAVKKNLCRFHVDRDERLPECWMTVRKSVWANKSWFFKYRCDAPVFICGKRYE